ncbi:uncharacterized protein LOC108088462 [Drosophila ficusphila]|uniref:uncharacterized protein LOC108088462 n=1 Tax=Drosophila ficusphila TaxID=30025 RepID=UPI0007E63E6B|nr:uncharacterized protein LOC108088462 [Drosophila ficusphila]
MGEIGLKPELSFEDNDDDHQESKKGKKKEESRWVSTRRYARLPLKIIALLATVYVCILSSERYFYYWVQTSIERTDMHVSEIHFPAVTIIPMNVTWYNLSQESQKLNKAYNLVQSVLWQTPMSFSLTEENFTEFSDIETLNVRKWAISESWQLNCKHFFAECQWRRKPINCCDIFRTGKALNGFAFVFNSPLAYNKVETWPWSVAGSGSKSGLNVKIKRQHSQYYIHSLGVIVHEPSQQLGNSIDYSSEERIVIPVEPLRFTAEPEVRARPLQMRRCLFKNESLLFETDRSECISTCHFNYMLKKCNCTLDLAVNATFDETNITDVKENSGQRICRFKDLICFNNHKLSMFSMSNIIEESKDNVFTTFDCGCFPLCDHTQYHTSTYTERLVNHNSESTDIEIDVYFEEETLFSYRSVLRFTLIDLMVSYGGIAGLIMGISVLGCLNNFLDRFACCRLPHNS